MTEEGVHAGSSSDSLDRELLDHFDDGRDGIPKYEDLPSTKVPTAVGVLITSVLSSAMVIPALKAGFIPGTSNLTIMPFSTLKAQGKLKSVGKLFVLAAQVAGTAGMCCTSGVAMGYPAGLMLQRDMLADGPKYGLEQKNIKVEYWWVVLECVAGVLMGSGFVQKFAAVLLQDGTDYAMPEAHMCVAMLNLVEESDNDLPYLGQALWLPMAIVTAVSVSWLLGYLPENLSFKIWDAKDVVTSRPTLSFLEQLKCTVIRLPVVDGIITMGVGCVLPPLVVLLTLFGSVLNIAGNIILLKIRTGALLGGIEDAEFINAQFPEKMGMKWAGAGAMTISITWTLMKIAYRFCCAPADESGGDGKDSKVSDNSGDKPMGRMTEVERKKVLLDTPTRFVIQQWVCIGLGLCLHLGMLISSDVSFGYIVGNMLVTFVGGACMTYLGAMLSLQIGGSCSPTSGTTLLLSLLHCVNLLVTVGNGQDLQVEEQLLTKYVPVTALSLVMSHVSTSFANDAIQDFATVMISGVPIAYGFVPQLVAALPSCFLVPLMLYYADGSMPLGIDRSLSAPQASTVGAVLKGIVWGSPAYCPLFAGVAIGLGAVVFEEIARAKWRVELPAMGLAMGLYLSPNVTVAMAFGSLAKTLGKRAYYKYRAAQDGRSQDDAWETQENSLCAAGFITSNSLVTLLLGISMNIEPEMKDMINIVDFEGYGTRDESCPTYILPGLACVVMLGALIGYNNFNGHIDPAIQMKQKAAAAAKAAHVEESVGIELADVGAKDD